jgi:Holliday junction resolvasome RuvABC endonuclease subunit
MPSNDPINRLIRVMDVATWLTDVMDRLLPNVLVAMEGYAFSRAGIASSDLHELGGLIKYWLVANRVPFRIYQPTTVKMAWAGSGNADKAQMQMACFHDSGIDYTRITGVGDGLADSYLIAKLLWWEAGIKNGERKFSDAPETVQKVLKRKTKAEPEELLTRELLCYGGKRDYNGLSANDPA